MADIKNPRLLYAKGALFVLGGVMAAGLILVEHPTIKVALLLAIAIWCFARAYYFALRIHAGSTRAVVVTLGVANQSPYSSRSAVMEKHHGGA